MALHISDDLKTRDLDVRQFRHRKRDFRRQAGGRPAILELGKRGNKTRQDGSGQVASERARAREAVGEREREFKKMREVWKYRGGSKQPTNKATQHARAIRVFGMQRNARWEGMGVGGGGPAGPRAWPKRWLTAVRKIPLWAASEQLSAGSASFSVIRLGGALADGGEREGNCRFALAFSWYALLDSWLSCPVGAQLWGTRGKQPQKVL